MGLVNNLPKTAYIKMVDVWFIGSMVIPFLEVKIIGNHKKYTFKILGNLTNLYREFEIQICC